MSDRPDKAYLQPYTEAVKQFGAGFEATLWNNPAAQRLRFDVMIELAGIRDARVLDVGCGPGDLAARLLEREIPFTGYVGIDAMPEMIEAAARRDLPGCRFVAGDAVADPALLRTGDPDYACISGTLNTMDDATAQKLVADAFAASAQGVVFNFLSTRHHPRFAGRDTTPARRRDPVAWLDFALSLSSRVAFTQTYLDGHDATIVVRTERE